MGVPHPTADLADAAVLAALASPGNSPLEHVSERQGGHKAWWACRLHTDGDWARSTIEWASAKEEGIYKLKDFSVLLTV